MREGSRRREKKRLTAHAAPRAAKATKPGSDKSGSSGDRLLAVLALFTVERPQWTVEAAANKLGVSVTTTYRYFKRLTKAGLITPISGANYSLGPAIVQMDRLIQISHPMLGAARGVMLALIQYPAEGSTFLPFRPVHSPPTSP